MRDSWIDQDEFDKLVGKDIAEFPLIEQIRWVIWFGHGEEESGEAR